VILNFRVSREVAERVQQLAAYHVRTRSDEMRLALALYDTQATLAYLQTPEAKAELGRDLPDAQRRVKAGLRDLTRAAFDRPKVSLAPKPREPVK
jgi:predicted transcriptional regulator